MKFVTVEKFGGTETLRPVEETDPVPQAGQVIIAVKAAGINFADIAARRGTYPNVKSAPFRPGYEVAGVVTALGDGVQGVAAGDRVMALLGSMGGYATHAVVPAEQVIPLPEGLDFAPATALLVQGLTAYFLLEAGQVGEGKTVLIPGAAGGLGTLAIQIAKRKGAKVIGLASPSKHELVRSYGADVVLDYTQPGWAQKVLDETEGKGVDIFLDSQGDLEGEGFDTLGEKAHWLIFGGQAEKRGVLTPERLGTIMGKNITLRGYMLLGDAPNFGRALTDLLTWAASGQLQINTTSFPLDEVAQAHEAIENRTTTGKVVLEP